MFTQQHINQFKAEGFTIVRGLFTQEEIDSYNAHFETMRQHEIAKNQVVKIGGQVADHDDPLKTYPRLMQPHRHDDTSLHWLIDERLNTCLTGMLGQEPYAVQTMFYFKPAGARGQALHQDQFYLRVQPGTCMAAWMALDVIDEENGCLQVVPGSQDWPVLCTTEANTQISFTDVTVELPEGATPIPVRMQPGDVLFFNGQLVHGSLPNISKDRFRRSLIGHYIVGEAEQVSKWYHPVLRMDGVSVEFGESEAGGTCGTWVNKDGEPVLEMQAVGND
jgi:ectoine hydroxylase-related dioxygenase (phytanoyl-CoA dioxygenase family)